MPLRSIPQHTYIPTRMPLDDRILDEEFDMPDSAQPYARRLHLAGDEDGWDKDDI